uniref:Uncharacterized protein n=1 Tax=Arundo donax TaxID=35708 RepID=A0A0A8Y2W3_ARUDO
MYAAESRDWLCMNDSMQEVEQESIIIQHLPCTVICYELVSF